MKRKESNTENKVILVNEVLSESLNVENGGLYSVYVFLSIFKLKTCVYLPNLSHNCLLISRGVWVCQSRC